MTWLILLEDKDTVFYTTERAFHFCERQSQLLDAKCHLLSSWLFPPFTFQPAFLYSFSGFKKILNFPFSILFHLLSTLTKYPIWFPEPQCFVYRSRRKVESWRTTVSHHRWISVSMLPFLAFVKFLPFHRAYNWRSNSVLGFLVFYFLDILLSVSGRTLYADFTSRATYCWLWL